MQTISVQNKSAMTLEALWTLIQGQSKVVRYGLAKRLNESIQAEKEAKTKMSETEFYAKIDRSIESSKQGRVIAMRDDETPDQFLERLLCTK